MAGYNPKIAFKLKELMKKNKLKPGSMSIKCQFVVSDSAIQNWINGQEPTREKLIDVLQFFPDENIEEWLALYPEAA